MFWIEIWPDPHFLRRANVQNSLFYRLYSFRKQAFEFDLTEKGKASPNFAAPSHKLRALLKPLKNLLSLAILLVFALAACRPEYRFAPEPVGLVRSQDTVFLDTVFATVGSSTRSIRLVNPSSYDVNLSRISLGRGSESPFRFNANGQPGPELENVVVAAGDSIWIFVETTAPRGDGEMLWEDSLRIEQGSFSQNVYLVALAWDAHFHYPNRVLTIRQEPPFADLLIPYVMLGPNEVWGSDKPHVVYGYAVVDSAATLDISAGARVHFHSGSGLWISSGGTLRVDAANTGSYENPVLLQGDRLEPFYRDIPGQWGGLLGGLFIQRGARAEIQNAWIRNGTLGIRCDSVAEGEPFNLILRRSRVTDFSRAAVYSGHGRVRLENSVLANSGLYRFMPWADDWRPTTAPSPIISLALDRPPPSGFLTDTTTGRGPFDTAVCCRPTFATAL